MKHSEKEKIEIARKICDLYSSGELTLESCCDAVGINLNTFYQWSCPTIGNFDCLSPDKQKELKRRGFIQEVQTLLKKAKQKGEINYKHLVKNKSRLALLDLLAGKEYEEIQVTEKKDFNGNILYTLEKRTKKYIPPDVTAIIFALKNMDKENFGEQSTIIHEQSSTERERVAKMTDEELDEEYNRLLQEVRQALEMHRKRDVAPN